MLKFSHKGNFDKTIAFLQRSTRIDPRIILDKYGRLGVSALAAATPVDTGETKDSWKYEVKKTRRGYEISWHNTKAAGTAPLVILLQYGHGTSAGTYIPGRDFINPAIGPILDSLSEELRKEVAR